jgi:sterol desaturase/sphingolipid hydroxylase (fatty acid hydroxylase superfamily)
MQLVNRSTSLWHRLFTAEPFIGERYRPLATAIVMVFAVVYSLSFLGLMQYVAYLGPGLGDKLNFGPFIAVFNHFHLASNGDLLSPPLLFFIILVAANLLFSAGIIVAGYWLYPRVLGKPFPLTILFTFFSLNAVCTLGIGALHALTGVIGSLLGYSFIDGLNAFAELLETIREWAQQVPTLLDLPAWLAFIMVVMVGGFFHYWFHRLAHESRLLWLLFHRTHHMTPELIQPTTQSVFNAFPFFLFATVPYVLIFSVLGKLLTNESILLYLIVFKLLSAFSNLFSHQTALYDWAQQQWPIRVLNTITSEGVYHYLHHSSQAQHNQARGNLVNIGGGLFFFWDRVFRTYRTATNHRPDVGLQGIAPAEMTANPLRLSIAGPAQLAYELWHNRGIKNRLAILFGPSDYQPTISRDYVLKTVSSQVQPASRSTVSKLEKSLPGSRGTSLSILSFMKHVYTNISNPLGVFFHSGNSYKPIDHITQSLGNGSG